MKNSKPDSKRSALTRSSGVDGHAFHSRFLAPLSFDPSKSLPKDWSLDCFDEGSSRIDFHDTYVWTLWFEKAVLFRRDGIWTLDCDGDIYEESGHPVHVNFPWDFVPGLMRNRLDDLISPRALRKTASARVGGRLWSYRNPQGKIVVRVRALHVSANKTSQGSALFLEIHPLRGYGAEASEIARHLEASGCQPTDRRVVDEAYKLWNIQPMPYLVKPVLEKTGADSSREAMLEVLRKMLGIARQNEEGIIKDFDTEFLHDFRVSIRKMRSILGIIKDVFPENLSLAWKKTLGDICRKTNKLRDLDVHLLSRERLEQTLPSALRSGLVPFFEELERCRSVEAVRVSAYFRSPGYRRCVVTLDSAWTSPESIPPTDKSNVSIQSAVAGRIAKRFKKIVKLSRGIDELTPDDVLHEARIECKKLRYLLDCFGHLFDSDGRALLVRQLSKLQNRLGRFNDTSVLQTTLLEMAQEPIQSGNAKLTLSLGALIGSLHQEHGAMRAQVISALRDFCSSENARLAESLSNPD